MSSSASPRSAQNISPLVQTSKPSQAAEAIIMSLLCRAGLCAGWQGAFHFCRVCPAGHIVGWGCRWSPARAAPFTALPWPCSALQGHGDGEPKKKDFCCLSPKQVLGRATGSDVKRALCGLSAERLRLGLGMAHTRWVQGRDGAGGEVGELRTSG